MTYQDLDESLAYNIMKTLFDRLPELIAIHKEAQSINLKDAASEKGSLITREHRSFQGKRI